MYIKSRELERKHLEEAVAEILAQPLVIITAPSGYGKTTLVKQFFEKHPEMKGTWLPFGNEEVDEVWVWRQLCDSISRRYPALSQRLTEIGLPHNAQETDYFIAAVRESIQEPVCIVLDDYHECNGKTINRLIERIIYEEIPNLHIMIISRIYPDIAFEEMLLKGYCTVIDQQMLALDKDESVYVFKINGIELSALEAEKMYEYTDGWIAAVYLLLYDYKKNGRFDQLTNVSRLLKKTIFDKLPEELQELCMKMSLFDQFTLAEARYILDKDVSFYALAQMKEQFGFIQFDTGTGTYVMHALLRSVAGGVLDSRGIDKSGLYRRCGEYREKTGKYISAMVCYRNAGESEKILQLLSGEMRDTIFEQAPGIVYDCLQMMPLGSRLAYPKAYLGYIYYIILKENAAKGKEFYLEACEKYKEYGQERPEYKKIKGELLVIQALLEFNDLERTNSRLKEAYELLGHQPSSIFDHSLLTFGTPFMSVLYYRHSGELQQTIQQEKAYARYHMRLMKGVDSSWDDFFEAEYALMRNDLDTAYTLSGKVKEKAAFGSWICILISSYYTRLRCLIQWGKEKEFYELMEEFEKQMERIVRPVLVTDYELVYGYVYACIGRLDKIPEWLRQFNLQECSRIVRNVRSGCVVYGILLCRMQKWVLLDAVAEQILVPYENTSHAYIVVFGYIFKAIAALKLEGKEKACEYFEKAVTLAEPDELRIPFVEIGGEILPLVEAMAGSSPFCAHLRPQIMSFQQAVKAFEVKTQTVVLTGREEELMIYVKEGLRNTEISEKMHIALVTVEKNLTSIYRKLNVSNRAAAIARMEELNTV